MNKTKIDAALKFGQDSLGLVATKIEIQFKYLHNDDGESSLVNNCIVINNCISLDKQILAIFHELVHFWQWKLDKLQFDLRRNKWIYNGVIQDGNYSCPYWWCFGLFAPPTSIWYGTGASCTACCAKR